MNPKNWSYLHILQNTNIVEFTNLETGNYFITIQSVNDESIDNPFKVSINGKSFEFSTIINNDSQKVGLTITNNNSNGVMDNFNTRRGGGFLSTAGSFALAGGNNAVF